MKLILSVFNCLITGLCNDYWSDIQEKQDIGLSPT